MAIHVSFLFQLYFVVLWDGMRLHVKSSTHTPCTCFPNKNPRHWVEVAGFLLDKKQIQFSLGLQHGEKGFTDLSYVTVPTWIVIPTIAIVERKKRDGKGLMHLTYLIVTTMLQGVQHIIPLAWMMPILIT